MSDREGSFPLLNVSAEKKIKRICNLTIGNKGGRSGEIYWFQSRNGSCWIVLTFCGKSPPHEIYLKTWNSEKKTENKLKAKGLINYIDFPFGPVGAVIKQHPVENKIKMWKMNVECFFMFGKWKKTIALNLGSMKNALSSVRKIEFPRQDPNPLTKLHHQTSRVEHI